MGNSYRGGIVDLLTLQQLLNPNERKLLHENILQEFRELCKSKYLLYRDLITPEGKIPLIKMSDTSQKENILSLKVFIGAQHNEYNGLFGILEFLRSICTNDYQIREGLLKKQDLLFFPLMNPHGFLYPREDNKSGYYLQNGTNLNRYWRRAFILDFKGNSSDNAQFPLPSHVTLFKEILKPYWDDSQLHIFFIDFHETSLLTRFPIDLCSNLSIDYVIDHWLKEEIIKNIIVFYSLPFELETLFISRSQNETNQKYMNLSEEEIEQIKNRLRICLKENEGKLNFFFRYSKTSKDFCINVANNVYHRLRAKLWNTPFFTFDHDSEDHGCFIKMNDNSSRKNLFAIELESEKQFFNLFSEIEQSTNVPHYFSEKLVKLNQGVELAREVIQQVALLHIR